MYPETFVLGFGCMRLPLLKKDDPTSFDLEKTKALFDEYLRQGFTYFDTAYTYHNYQGELAVRAALVERYPREAYQLVTKLPLRDFKTAEDMERIFNEQLERLGVTWFDRYLLHNMGRNVYRKCVDCDAFGLVRKKKEEGRIGLIGMSFHDTPELLEEVLQKYGDGIDFVQLQVNYLDWEQPNVQSRRCVEIAAKYRKPVTVMEPCKGGTLVHIPSEAQALLRSYAPDSSPASWALRFAACCPGVTRVLSGMNEMEQVLDNCKTLREVQPLSEEEYTLLQKVTDIINSKTAVACTGCEYCTHGCPKHIAIPKYFALYNSILRTTCNNSSQRVYFNNISLQAGKPSECLGCGKCEQACPQHLPIRQYLKDVAEKFEKTSAFPNKKPS